MLILRQLPFRETETTVSVAEAKVTIRAYQIIVWISLTRQKLVELDPDTPRFPAVLDTGNNHNFALQREHLAAWSGLDPSTLVGRGQIQVGNQVLPLVEANVWIHRNQPGERDTFSKRPPFCLELPEGIAVYPPGVSTVARLPILGLRALVRNGLHLTIDGKNHHVNLRT